MLFGHAGCKSNKYGPRARTHILTLNNTQFVSFFGHRRKSRDRFGIYSKITSPVCQGEVILFRDTLYHKPFLIAWALISICFFMYNIYNMYKMSKFLHAKLLVAKKCTCVLLIERISNYMLITCAAFFQKEC